MTSLLISLLFFSILPITLSEDTSCLSNCSLNESTRCGTWLVEEDLQKRTGVYELNQGVVNVSCVFSSLPRPATVVWSHRGKGESSWNAVRCNSQDEHRQCSTEGEQKVASRCIIRTNNLTLTGALRCEGTTMNHDHSQTHAKSSETQLEVVGIEKVEALDTRLKPGKSGHVEVEICANPRPEVWWSTREGLILPGDGKTGFASSHLAVRMSREEEGGPAKIVPYCYQIRLVVQNVERKENIQIIVRAEQDTITRTINYVPMALPSLLLLLIPLLL